MVFRNKGLSIEIHSENTCDNLGLRGVAKLLLNSIWGKIWSKIYNDRLYLC